MVGRVRPLAVDILLVQMELILFLTLSLRLVVVTAGHKTMRQQLEVVVAVVLRKERQLVQLGQGVRDLQEVMRY